MEKIKSHGVHCKTYKCKGEGCGNVWKVIFTDTIKDDEWLINGLCLKCLEKKIKVKKSS